MTITIKDIARIAGVSHTTVSRALNDDARIKPETKKRIRRIANENHYVPNLMARHFVQRKTAAIGIIINYIGNSFMQEIMEGIEQVTESRHYVNLIGNSRESAERENRYIQTFLERRVDGLIIYPALDDCLAENLKLLKHNKTPYVLIDKYCEEIDSDYVVCDDHLGAQLAINHLIALGHQRIGHITSIQSTSLANRLQGYRQALNNHDIPYLEEFIGMGSFDSRHSFYDAYDATRKLLALPRRPTALFVSTDGLIPTVFRAIRDAGLRIAHDVAVVGFGDDKSIALMDVPLTTVAYPTLQVGQMASGLLIDRIEKKDMNAHPRGISLRPELIIRKSCGYKQ